MINIYPARDIKVISISILLLLSFNSHAKRPEYNIEIKNHLFYPAKIVIPANKKVKLIIYNHDDKAEQFDSFDLNREKVIFPHQVATIFIGPLPAGEYDFFGEYHPHSARGKIVAVKQTIPKEVVKGEQDAN